jgi:hypothetical protein
MGGIALFEVWTGFLTVLRCSTAGQGFPIFRLIVIPAIAVAAFTLRIRDTGMDLEI